MRKSIAVFIGMIVCWTVTGCTVIGKTKEYQPFDASKIDALSPGKTVAADVTRLFGAPTEMVKLSNGNAYIYRRAVTKGTALWLVLLTMGNFDTQYDQVALFFDKDNVLTHFGVSLNAEQTAYGLPF
jgi:outer membrane protein assembly factor BamE (lipoprotein component of BamABCDE complex)